MSETKTFEITLPIDLARKVEARVASGEYESVSDLVRDTLDEPVGHDAEVERWLREEAVPTYDRMAQDPSRGVPIDEAERRLGDYTSRSQTRDMISNKRARRTDP